MELLGVYAGAFCIWTNLNTQQSILGSADCWFWAQVSGNVGHVASLDILLKDAEHESIN